VGESVTCLKAGGVRIGVKFKKTGRVSVEKSAWSDTCARS